VRQTAGKNNLNRIESCNLMAKCLMFQGDFSEAMRYSDLAATRYNEEIGSATIYKVPMLMTRGEICWNQQQYENAFKAFKEANEIQLNFANTTFGRLSEYEKENFAAKLKDNTTMFFAFAAEALAKEISFKNDLLNETYFLQINSKAKILDESNRMLAAITNSKDPETKNLYAQWIGSGAIEATHRNLVQKRLKLSGQRWTIPGAQNVLNLRCLNLSNDWKKVVSLITETEIHKVAA
jgi:tetratricopeptide (TPR) repeat protein